MEVSMDYIPSLKGYVEGTVSVEELQRVYFSDAALQKLLIDDLPDSLRNYAEVRYCNGDINEVFHLSLGNCVCEQQLARLSRAVAKGKRDRFYPDVRLSG